MNLRRKGYIAENIVKEYLISQNYNIIDQNFTIRGGEIDIIAENDKLRIFIEVKEVDHTDDLHGYVTKKKLSTLLRSINAYNYKYPTAKQLRVDLVFVKQNTILQHCENITNT